MAIIDKRPLIKRCPVCGKNLALVGLVHNCVPSPSFGTVAAMKPQERRAIAELGSRSSETIGMVPCPVCEARKLKHRESQKRYRARLSAKP